MTLLDFPTKKTTRKSAKAQPSARSRSMTRKLRNQRYVASAIFAFAACAVAVSLNDLAMGIADHTSTEWWQFWPMSIAIDLLFLSHKAANMVAATDATRRKIAPFTTAMVIGTSLLSAYLNAYEFTKHAVNNVQLAGGIVVGFAIPAMIFASLYVGFHLWNDANRD